MRRRIVTTTILLVMLVCLPWIVELRPNEIDLQAVLHEPSRAHPLGTDENGRDVLQRLLAGAQLTLGIGLASASLSVAVGSLLGAIAGSMGRLVDDIIMRTTDFAMSLPTLFVVLIFSTLIQPGVVQLILLIGLTGWMPVARVVRGAAREVSTRQFILAAHAYGAGWARIVLRHVLPNLAPAIAVMAVIQLSRSILTEATISFLGAGIQPPDPTWGSMLSAAQGYLLIAPWLALAPGIAISSVLVLIANINLSNSDSQR